MVFKSKQEELGENTDEEDFPTKMGKIMSKKQKIKRIMIMKGKNGMKGMMFKK